MKHTLAHALTPAKAGCECVMRDITECVICERPLMVDRKHTDTCSERCFKKLCSIQAGLPNEQ